MPKRVESIAADKGCPLCKGTLHLRRTDEETGKTVWVRCSCFRDLSLRQSAGPVASVTPESFVIDLARRSWVIHTSLDHVLPMSRFLFDEVNPPTLHFMRATELVDVFLGQHATITGFEPIFEYPLLVLMLGYDDPANRKLHEFVHQVLSCRHMRLYTYTFMFTPFSLAELGSQYSTDLAHLLEGSFGWLEGPQGVEVRQTAKPHDRPFLGEPRPLRQTGKRGKTDMSGPSPERR